MFALTRSARVPNFNMCSARSCSTKTTQTFDALVIGGGAAGMSAAINGRFEGLNIGVCEAKRWKGGSFSNTPSINNLPGHPLGISGASLSEATIQQFQKLGGFYFPGTSIKRISNQVNLFSLDDQNGNSYLTKTIVLATGIVYRKLDLPNAKVLEGKGIYYEVDDSICGQVSKQKIPIYLYGGGNAAGQAAAFYRSFGARVVLIHRNDSLQKSMSKYLINRIETLGCEVIHNTVITEVTGEKMLASIKIRNLESNEIHEFATSYLFVLIGGDAAPLPYVDFDTIAVDKRGYVKVDVSSQGVVSYQTSVKKIYAAGDITSVGAGRIQLAQAQGVQAIMQAMYSLE